LHACRHAWLGRRLAMTGAEPVGKHALRLLTLPGG